MRKKYITLSRKEIYQMQVMELLKNKRITQRAAAKMLGLSVRQVRNKSRRYEKEGPDGLIHKNKGRASPRKWGGKEKELFLDLCNGDFKGFGPTLLSEKLKELHGIEKSKETLRKVMIEEGITKNKARKPHHRTQRLRKENYGEMVQLDGSVHDWFEGRGQKCTFLTFVDDATSKMWGMFVESESTESVMTAVKKYFETHGRPLSFYVDFGSVFSVNVNNAEREKLTQFQRACKECDVKIIHAHSPQAKGRVERVHKTLQDRLIKELRINGIDTIEAANSFVIDTFIPFYNKRFSVTPKFKEGVHKSVKGLDLNHIFCLKEKRTLRNDFTISFKKRIFQLHEQQRTIIRPKNRITVSEHLDGNITLAIRNTQLFFSEIIPTNPTKVAQQKKTLAPSSFWKYRTDWICEKCFPSQDCSTI